MAISSEKVIFVGSLGKKLSGKLDKPEGLCKGWGIFAHCFTCSKDYLATSRISKLLAEQGIGMLRFDFTGLGESEGSFGETTFSSNVEDLVAASKFLAGLQEAPKLLVGHSLGGAAVLYAASRIPSVTAVATLNAPCNPQHVKHHFEHMVETLCYEGQAEVEISGRKFTMGKEFVEDLNEQKTDAVLKKTKAALLVCHSPQDDVVNIEQAAHIFSHARHPKSFVSLDTMGHLLTDPEDAQYIANVVASWASRYL